MSTPLFKEAEGDTPHVAETVGQEWHMGDVPCLVKSGDVTLKMTLAEAMLNKFQGIELQFICVT